MENLFINAKYVSVWDDGIEIKSNCLFNPLTKEVKDIEMVDIQGVENLIEEYIELPDGTIIRDFNDEEINY